MSTLSGLMRLAGLAATVAAVGIACSPHAPSAPVRDTNVMADRLDAFVGGWMKSRHVTGAAVAVMDGSAAVYERGFGYAVKSREVPVNADTAFLLASVTKLFTAVAVMQLVETGRIRLDDPVADYLPEFRPPSRFPPGRPMTVRDLLTHHGGIPSDYLKDMRFGETPPPDFANRFMEIPALLAREAVDAPPGSYYQYANTGFCLLGAIVARTSGTDYVSYVEQNILRPLGMNHSGFTDSAELRPFISRGYINGKERAMVYDRGIPEGGLMSSIHDLEGFTGMLLGGGARDGVRILKPASLEEMLRPQGDALPLDFGSRMGLAFHLGTTAAGVPFACHDGGMLPFSSTLVILPEHGLGVIVLANSEEVPVGPVAEQAVQWALEARSGGVPDAGMPRTPIGATPAPDLGPYAGSYASELGLCDVCMVRGIPRLDMPGGSFTLVPAADGSHQMRVRLFGLIPVGKPGVGGISLRFATIQGERVIGIFQDGRFVGIAAELRTHPVPPAWKTRVARYEIVNQDAVPFLEEFAIEYDSRRDLLFCVVSTASGSRPLRLPLDPISDTLVVTAGKGRHLGDSIQAQTSGGEEYLAYSGFRLKAIRK